MVVLVESVDSDLVGSWLIACRGHIEGIFSPRQSDVNDAPALSDRQRDSWGAGRRLAVTGMFFASPAFHDEAEPVRIEEQPLLVAGSRPSQVDQADDWDGEIRRRLDR